MNNADLISAANAFIVWWMEVDYELIFATLCTGFNLLVILSLGYILIISFTPSCIQIHAFHPL